MNIERLFRLRAAPEEHLGGKSLTRLEAFERGYEMFMKEPEPADSALAFRDWVVACYDPGSQTTLSASEILLKVTHDDERAFELFFDALDSAIARKLVNPGSEVCGPKEEPLPSSGFLNALGVRPYLFLPRLSSGCLRAFLDGYSLAAIEHDRTECCDLDGFEQWTRVLFNLKGYFRWDKAFATAYAGDEVKAFERALSELKAYRTSKGLPNIRDYEVIVSSPAQSPKRPGEP
jgi:hypothetical protein